jgi:hypothetical protein
LQYRADFDPSLLAIIMADVKEIVIPSPADFHSHLRQGELMKLVAPHVHKGGVDLAYVMVTTLYRARLLNTLGN